MWYNWKRTITRSRRDTKTKKSRVDKVVLSTNTSELCEQVVESRCDIRWINSKQESNIKRRVLWNKNDIRDHDNWCHEGIDEGGNVNCDSNEHKRTLWTRRRDWMYYTLHLAINKKIQWEAVIYQKKRRRYNNNGKIKSIVASWDCKEVNGRWTHTRWWSRRRNKWEASMRDEGYEIYLSATRLCGTHYSCTREEQRLQKPWC